MRFLLVQSFVYINDNQKFDFKENVRRVIEILTYRSRNVMASVTETLSVLMVK